jgi:translation initiation factor 2 alpha subunit (eIF-2alpha)
LTGKHKFGRGYPIADYVLVFGKDGKTNKWRDANDENYISEIASKTKIEVSWKSSYRKVESETGRNYTFFSVLRLAQNNLKTEMSKYDGQMLTEGLLTNIWTKFQQWFSQLWKKVKSWLHESYENLLSFLELDGSVSIGSVEL